jgi:peptidoglycan/xylan/chitin deacetylase (PgdA/CDA1 family)
MEQVFKITRHRWKFLWEMLLLALSCLTLIHIGAFLAHELHFSNSNKDLTLSTIQSQTTAGIGIESIIDWGDTMIAVHYPTTPNQAVNQQLLNYATDRVNQFKHAPDVSPATTGELYISFETYKSGDHVVGFKFDITERRGNSAYRHETQKLSFHLQTGEQLAFETYFDANNQPIAIAVVPENTAAAPITPEDPKDKKLIALTFDDGPHGAHTPALLDILQRENAPATFFALGSRANHYPDIIKRTLAAGHQVENHTFNHKNLTKLPLNEVQYEIGESANVLERITGARPTLTRPPYGAVNQTVKDVANTPLMMWSIDPEDWKTRDPDQIFHHVVDNAEDGSIVLLHDIYDTTLAAVAKIIPELKSRGFVFLTIKQIMDARAKTLENGVIYRHAKP